MYKAHARYVNVNITIKIQCPAGLNGKCIYLGQGYGQILLLFASDSLLVYAKYPLFRKNKHVSNPLVSADNLFARQYYSISNR